MSGNVDLEALIADIPDYPEPGVVFKDITPMLADPKGFKACIDQLCAPFADKGITKIMGAEARGFIIGAPMAYAMDCGFVPARKKGKLPRETSSYTYDLEYGTDTIEIHADAISEDDVVLIVDDVLATGGTAAAKAELVSCVGAKLAGFAFFLELDFLHGRDKLDKFDHAEIVSLVHAE